MVDDALTHKILGCAMRVHTILGGGFQELIYQPAIELELSFENISFIAEKEMSVYYRDVKIGVRRVDLFIEIQLRLN